MIAGKQLKGMLWVGLLSFSLGARGGADTLPVQADSQVNLTAVAAKGGALTTVSVKNSLPGAAYRGFAKFDLRALQNGLPVAKATLRLWPNLVTTEGNVDVVAVLAPWEEATLTAITAPVLSQAITDFSVTKADLKTYLSVDITELVKDWVSQALPNHGLALVGQPQAPVNVRFDSKENSLTSHPMELEVILGLPPGSGDITGIVPQFGIVGGGNVGDIPIAVNPSLVQKRVVGACPQGWSIQSINAEGAVVCQPGDITAVTPSAGLIGGGTAGDVALGVDFSTTQRRVVSTCATGSSIRGIDSFGSVICQKDTGFSSVSAAQGTQNLSPTPALSFLGPTRIFTIVSGQKIVLNASKGFGSTLPNGAGALRIAPCYRSTAAGATLSMEGSGISGLKVDPGTRHVFAINWVYSLPAGTWEVGMCGDSAQAPSWNSNDRGYVTAFTTN